MINWPARINLAQLPTAITPLTRFSRRFKDLTIWVKRDEQTGLELSGNKVRKLEFTIAEALEQSCDTLISCGGIQSNHCRATAIAGAGLGLKVHLILRGEKPAKADGNLLLDYLCGAEVTYLPQQEFHQHIGLARQLQEKYKQRGHKAFFIPIGASDEIGLWGYVAASQEIQQGLNQLQIDPEYIVTATGSGGTQAGLIAGCRLFGLKAEVLAFNVCDDADYFENKIRADLSLWKSRYKIDLDVKSLPINTVDGYVGPGYGIADDEIYDTIAELARTEAIFLDPVYTAKAFHGMLSEIKKGEAGRLAGAKNILFIHTGGLFGVFPHQGKFTFLDSTPG